MYVAEWPEHGLANNRKAAELCRYTVSMGALLQPHPPCHYATVRSHMLLQADLQRHLCRLAAWPLAHARVWHGGSGPFQLYTVTDSNVDVALLACAVTAAHALLFAAARRHRQKLPAAQCARGWLTVAAQLLVLAKALCVAIGSSTDVWPTRAPHGGARGRYHAGVACLLGCLAAAFVLITVLDVLARRSLAASGSKVRASAGSCLKDAWPDCCDWLLGNNVTNIDPVARPKDHKHGIVLERAPFCMPAVEQA